MLLELCYQLHTVTTNDNGNTLKSSPITGSASETLAERLTFQDQKQYLSLLLTINSRTRASAAESSESNMYLRMRMLEAHHTLCAQFSSVSLPPFKVRDRQRHTRRTTHDRDGTSAADAAHLSQTSHVYRTLRSQPIPTPTAVATHVHNPLS